MSATPEQIRLLTEYIEDALCESDDSDEQPFGERPQVERDASNSLIVRHEDGYSAVRVTVDPFRVAVPGYSPPHNEVSQ